MFYFEYFDYNDILITFVIDMGSLNKKQECYQCDENDAYVHIVDIHSANNCYKAVKYN